MRFCTFRLREEPVSNRRLGVVKNTRVFESGGQKQIADYVHTLGSGSSRRLKLSEVNHPLTDVIMSAPIPRPGKIVATIVNTKGMLGGDDVTLGWPRLDMKAPSTVIGPGEKILAPGEGIRPEVELAAVMGKRTWKATNAQSKRAIFGYTILNDVTAPADSRSDAYEAYRRDKKTGEIKKTTMRGPLFRSKNHDTFCPMGPSIVTPEEIDVEKGLRMSTRFMGDTVQDGSTAEYLFQPWEIVSYISGFLSLDPGDVVSCGSVGWVPDALGELDPTEFILPSKKGILELEIEGVGRLSNPVVPS